MEQSSIEVLEISFNLDKTTLITYNRNDIVGWGSFSYNFKGQMTKKQKTSKVVAIKEIKLRSLIDPYDTLSLQSAMTEINILKHLKHKNVVKFLGFHQLNNERIIIIQKFCNQGDMASFLTKNQFMSQEGVMHFFLQMLNGFKYLIEQKVFHGDIKPENIFLHNDKVKIGDFGLSVKLKSLTDTFKDPVGSPGFMSPEILNGEEYTIASDIWALGITLYYMIYEKMPWGDLKNPIKLNKYLKELKEKQGELVNFPESWRFPVSSELKTLIKRMIAYDVKERITWNELFKSTGVFLEGGKKNKKGISPLLYKKIDEKNINKAMENYCSPMLWMDVNEGNVNKIKIWEYTKSQYCKGN